MYSSLLFVAHGSVDYIKLTKLLKLRDGLICHAGNPELSDIEFSQAWQDACDALVHFGVGREEIVNITTGNYCSTVSQTKATHLSANQNCYKNNEISFISFFMK